MNVFTVKMNSETPEALNRRQAGEDDDSSGSEENGEEMPPITVAMLGTIFARPLKTLHWANPVMVGPGEIVHALMEVALDNGQIIILDGYVGVIHGRFVVSADQMLPGRDVFVGTSFPIAVEGEIDISPEKLKTIAHACRIVGAPVEIKVDSNLRTVVVPQCGPYAEAARHLVVSHDSPVHANGLFQARVFRPAQQNDFVRLA
jgi:hypothetical protein